MAEQWKDNKPLRQQARWFSCFSSSCTLRACGAQRVALSGIMAGRNQRHQALRVSNSISRRGGALALSQMNIQASK